MIGVFRTCAEVTMKLLRENRENLMTILETFLHDPLVEWSNSKATKVTLRLLL